MIVTFMSDFGTEDGYLGAVKGRIKKEDPNIEIIDIGHSIPPYDIKKAAYTLLTYYNHFPKGTVHLCVVDPGVGSDRNAIIVESEHYRFVGPDNGLFDLLLKQESVKAYRINMNEDWILTSTFHGRDIFAPVAASLAKGKSPGSLGKLIKNFKNRENVFFYKSDNTYIVKPLTADRFGNIIFGLKKTDIGNQKIKRVDFMGQVFTELSTHYAQNIKNQALCLWNSLDYFEIALNRASALSSFKPDFKRDKANITVD